MDELFKVNNKNDAVQPNKLAKYEMPDIDITSIFDNQHNVDKLYTDEDSNHNYHSDSLFTETGKSTDHSLDSFDMEGFTTYSSNAHSAITNSRVAISRDEFLRDLTNKYSIIPDSRYLAKQSNMYFNLAYVQSDIIPKYYAIRNSHNIIIHTRLGNRPMLFAYFNRSELSCSNTLIINRIEIGIPDTTTALYDTLKFDIQEPVNLEKIDNSTKGFIDFDNGWVGISIEIQGL